MGTEPIRRYMYVSTAVADFSDDELTLLAEGAATRNTEKGITGILLYKGGSFLQVIEGPVRAMDELIGKINADDRHTFIEVLLNERASRRYFHNWEMRLCNLESGPPPATVELMTIAQFVSRCPMENTRPVVEGFIRHFTEGSFISLDSPAA